ncbi:MAG: family N-acetyltransferase [Gemmatimonadetes bacterium]|nr:family N-acetyltransferase [Gemmatimonadota bacterium]
MITTRAFQPADKPALYDLLAEVWPGESAERHDRRWWWQREETPLRVAVDEDGTIAGMCGHIPFIARSESGMARAAWIVDFFVRQRFQGQGLGKRLVRSIGSDFDFLASLNQTDAAYMAFSRDGWTARSSVPLMISVSPRFFRLASSLRNARGVRVERGAPAFDESFDALWSEVNAGLVCAVRDRAALTARFATPTRDYHLVRAQRDGRLAGYAVMRVLPPGSIRSFARFPIVMVSDYYAPAGDAVVFTALMQEVARFASEQRVRFVLCMSTHRAHQRALGAGGFLSHESPAVGPRLRKLAVGFTTTPSAPPGAWHLTPFDCDLDILFGAQA